MYEKDPIKKRLETNGQNESQADVPTIPHRTSKIDSLAQASKSQYLKAGLRGSNISESGFTTLMNPQIADDFISDLNVIHGKWSNLLPDERVKEIESAVCMALKRINIPPVTFLTSSLRAAGGEFMPQNWSISLSEKIITENKLTYSDFRRMTSSLFHEMRHAEQHFQSARYLFSIKRGKINIISKLKIPEEILKSAKALPLSHKSNDWHNAKKLYMYIFQETSRRKILREAIQVYSDLLDTHTTLWSRIKFLTLRWKYVNLPTEKDARNAVAFFRRRLALSRGGLNGKLNYLRAYLPFENIQLEVKTPFFAFKFDI